MELAGCRACLERLKGKPWDLGQEYPAKDVEGAKIPPVFDTDEDALGAALASCLRLDPATARIVRVRSTKDLELLWISEPALADALATGRCEVVEPARPIAFDADGMLGPDMPDAVHGAG